jgi:hypothetical protein
MKAPMYAEYSEFDKNLGWKKTRSFLVMGFREDYPNEAIINHPELGPLTVEERGTKDWIIKFIWE